MAGNLRPSMTKRIRANEIIIFLIIIWLVAWRQVVAVSYPWKHSELAAASLA